MIRSIPVSFRFSFFHRFPSFSSSLHHRSFTSGAAAVPTTKHIQDIMNKEKIPSVDSPTGSISTSKTEGDAKKWAEGVVKTHSTTNDGQVAGNESQGQSTSNNNQPAPFPGSSLDLFRQLRPPIPSLSSMLQPFHSMMPKSVRRQIRSIEDWMNENMTQPFALVGGGQGENQSGELTTDFRDLWYDFDKELSRPVSLTLDEKHNEYIAKLELKGFEKKDLSIRVQDDYLIINGSMTKNEEKERKDQGKMNRSTSSSFTRVLALPDHIDKNNIKAKYEGSVLVLTIPKDKEKMEYGRIQIE